MKKTLLRRALGLALSQAEKHTAAQKYAHWSFIVQSNKIVDWGTNQNVIPPIYLGYSKSKDDDFIPKTHAEFAAWKKAKGLLDDKPFEVINIRLNKRGEPKMSAPCKCCHGFLKVMGCSKVFYTTESGWSKALISA